MAKLLITGAGGLIGSHLLPLFGADDELHVIARPGSGAAFAPDVRVYPIDLGKPFDDRQLPDQVDGVIYLAQSERFREFPEHARDVFEVNVASVARLLDYARRANASSFVLASSGGVYGAARNPVEEQSLVPATGRLGFYLSTKLCAEILAENYAPHMNVVILRLFFAYGRGQRRSMLIPRLVDNIRAGRAISLAGEEGIRINPIHASDAAQACKAALAIVGMHRINVAGPEVLSLRQMCETIGPKVGREPIFDIQPTGIADHMSADIGMMCRLLCTPERQFGEGVEDLL